jgi:hypothetical protein
VDHVTNEGRQAGICIIKVRLGNISRERCRARTYVHHVKAKGLASYGLENIVDERLFEEAYIHDLDVGEIAHEFESNA